MTLGIALVLEHCVVGTETLAAGAQDGFWRHDSCFLPSHNLSVICLIVLLQELGEAHRYECGAMRLGFKK